MSEPTNGFKKLVSMLETAYDQGPEELEKWKILIKVNILMGAIGLFDRQADGLINKATAQISADKQDNSKVLH